jgi:hypothetical protein
MKRTLAALSLLALLGLARPASTLADTTITGQVGKAHYRITVPTTWNGGLVFWNHGFTLSPPGPVTDLGPLSTTQLSQGYAVAATSYRMAGWALFRSTDDLEDLYRIFVEQVGLPNQVIVTGASLGGIVTVAALEQGELGNVTGALSLCGALAGSRNWDGALDIRLGYDVICQGVPGAAIPGGAEGLPMGSTMTNAQMAAAVHACTGILLPAPNRSPQQQQRLDRLLQLTGLPENFVLTDMGFATFALSDLVHDVAKLRRKVGAGNANVQYGIPDIDQNIARVWPMPGAGLRLAENYTPTGRIGAAKVVTIHTDKDGLVIVENEHEYAQVVPRAQLTQSIAVEATPSHCGFSNAETLASWEGLRGWIAGGPQPTPATIQAACQVLAPTVGGPCRIDPAFVVPPMDGRIRPR